MCFCLVVASCFKDEPLNAECDIEQAYLHADNPEQVFFNVSDSLVTVISSESAVRFEVRRTVDLTALSPRFRLTEGATISPENGSTHDFSQGPVSYTVTSEDGKWHRTYQVSVIHKIVTTSEVLAYNFEHYALNTTKPAGKYYVWSEVDSTGTVLFEWATANAGYQLSRGTAKPDEYPTTPDVNGYDGACVKLTTCDTGPFGSMTRMPIAAGNLFTGRFESASALMNPMSATHFGQPVDVQPISFSGYYRYQRGATMTDRDKKTLTGRQDYGTIYAVLYDNHDAQGNAVVLYGDNAQTSSQIVAIAKVPDISNTPDWIAFNVVFDYTKDIDIDKLNNYGYSLAVICSSSVDGNIFEGAIGSTLWVDKIKIECAKKE